MHKRPVMRMAGLGSALAPGKNVGPDEARASAGFWELQLFALFGRLQPQKRLQPSLIPLDLVRPVTPKVAGSSPVAPASSINDLLLAGYFGCNFLAPLPATSWLARMGSGE